MRSDVVMHPQAEGRNIPKIWAEHSAQFMLKTALSALGKSRVVLCAGRFDDPQLSDIDLFRAARQLGDTLVVGVSDDASCENTQEQRASALAALDCVDFVVIFNQDPVRLSWSVSPAAIVETADYSKADFGVFADKVVGLSAIHR